jgi:hypothetical protein
MSNPCKPKIELYPGLRVGSVELLTEVEPREALNGEKLSRQWEVVCDCGGHAFRTTFGLRHAISYNHDTCCEACLQELRRGLKEQVQLSRRNNQNFVRDFLEYGSLYPPGWGEANLEPTIDLAMFEPDHPVRNIPLLHFGYETDLTNGSLECSQQNQWLLPIEGLSWWTCLHCQLPITEGFGCVRCISHVCTHCKVAEKHQCPNDWITTWEGETKDSNLLTRRLEKLKQRSRVRTDTKLQVICEYQEWKHAEEQARLVDRLTLTKEQRAAKWHAKRNATSERKIEQSIKRYNEAREKRLAASKGVLGYKYFLKQSPLEP